MEIKNEEIKEFIGFIKELAELNNTVDFCLASRLDRSDKFVATNIFASVTLSELKLPEGFYILDGKITNRTDAFDSKYKEYSFNEISKVDDFRINDINNVNEYGLTVDELAELESKENKEKETEEIVEEEKKKKTSSVLPFFRSKDKERKNIFKKASCKQKELFSKVKERFSKKETIDESTEKYLMQQQIAVEHLIPKIADDRYIIARISNEKIDLDALYKQSPELCVRKLKEYAMIKEFHDFVVEDQSYNDSNFNTIMNGIINLSQNHTSRANRLLQEVRYGGITENQMEFLKQRLDYYMTHQVDKNEPLKRNEQQTKDDQTKQADTPIKSGTTTGGTGSSTSSSSSSGSSDIPKPEETVTNPTVEREKARLAENNRIYTEEKNKLYNDLGEYERAFVDDAKAEGLEVGDNEFNQMINERVVDKQSIYLYYVLVEELKIKKAYADLDETEKMFVEDAKAEGLDPSDNEFNQMLSERTVNKQAILEYIKIDLESKKKIEKYYEAINSLDAGKSI